MGGGQDKMVWAACPPSLQIRIQSNATKKTAELTYIMFIIDKCSHSDNLK